MTHRNKLILGAIGLSAVVAAIAYAVGNQNANSSSIEAGKKQANDMFKSALQNGIDNHMTLGEVYLNAFPDATPDEITHL